MYILEAQGPQSSPDLTAIVEYKIYGHPAIKSSDLDLKSNATQKTTLQTFLQKQNSNVPTEMAD